MVRLNATLYGRGPIVAKTYVHDDLVVCVLESVFTTAERTLISYGKAEEVRRSREGFIDATNQEFSEIVAKATGRVVRGCVGSVHTDLDTAVKVFFLDPEAQQAQSGNGAAYPE